MLYIHFVMCFSYSTCEYIFPISKCSSTMLFLMDNLNSITELHKLFNQFHIVRHLDFFHKLFAIIQNTVINIKKTKYFYQY